MEIMTLDLEMTTDDQSYQDLLQACGEHFPKRSRTDLSSDGRARNGQERPKRNSNASDSTSASSGRQDDLWKMIAKLTLCHEDQINEFNLDRSFLIFAQCGRGSLMPQMLERSCLWSLGNKQERSPHPCARLCSTRW